MLENISVYTQDTFLVDEHYLWIWNPTNIPPHMGLSVSGGYFSLKASGVDINSSVSELIEMIARKRIPVLAVRLTSNFDLDQCVSVFSKYKHTIAHEVTCLNPIKSVLNQSAPNKLSELLSELDAKGAIQSITSWNINQSTIELAEYSAQDIHDHLVSLSK